MYVYACAYIYACVFAYIRGHVLCVYVCGYVVIRALIPLLILLQIIAVEAGARASMPRTAAKSSTPSARAGGTSGLLAMSAAGFKHSRAQSSIPASSAAAAAAAAVHPSSSEPTLIASALWDQPGAFEADLFGYFTRVSTMRSVRQFDQRSTSALADTQRAAGVNASGSSNSPTSATLLRAGSESRARTDGASSRSSLSSSAAAAAADDASRKPGMEPVSTVFAFLVPRDDSSATGDASVSTAAARVPFSRQEHVERKQSKYTLSSKPRSDDAAAVTADDDSTEFAIVLGLSRATVAPQGANADGTEAVVPRAAVTELSLDVFLLKVVRSGSAVRADSMETGVKGNFASEATEVLNDVRASIRCVCVCACVCVCVCVYVCVRVHVCVCVCVCVIYF